MGKLDSLGASAPYGSQYASSSSRSPHSTADASSGNFHSLDTEAPPPPYSTIAQDGSIIRAELQRSGTGNMVETLPVASTTAAAINYAATHPLERNRGTSNSAPQAFQESIDKFKNSTKFSAFQKQGIEDFYQKYSVPIGIAHQLEALVDHRFEFVMDNAPDSSSTASLVEMSNEILKKVELLRHIPNQGIAIRVASSYDQPRVFTLDEKHPDQIFNDIKSYLQSVLPARREVASIKNIYDAVVGDAVVSSTKTIPYIFTARDLSGQKGRRSGLTKEARIDAKNLTKTIVNRPVDQAPTAFFPRSNIPASDEVIEKFDTVAKRVSVISTFAKERASIVAGQSELFPYSEGINTHASLMSPVSDFWDQIDEGVIFSKSQLENHLATPLSKSQYNLYFEKALDRQARKFQKAEAEADAQPRYNSSRISSFAGHGLEFAKSTNALEREASPHLQKMLFDFRNHKDWSAEVEAGINRYCAMKNVPIGMGLHLIEAVGKHHEINLDNSMSMILRADQEDESADHLERDFQGNYYDPEESRHPSRLTEGKQLATRLGEALSFIPVKSVTYAPLNLNRSTDLKTFYDNTAPGFLRQFLAAVNATQLSDDGTPLNMMTVAMNARAKDRLEPSSATIISDGGPNDRTSAYSPPFRRREDTIVDQGPVREMMFHMTNRNPDKLGVTIAQCTNNPKATAWGNLADNICSKVNAMDDFNNEMGQVRQKQGSSFPYNQEIYTLALILGTLPLFDKLDEDGIYSKTDMECLLGRSMSGKEYDNYFNEAYARQCDPQSESVKSDPIDVIQNFGARRSATVQGDASARDRSALNRMIGSAGNMSISSSSGTGPGRSNNAGASNNPGEPVAKEKFSFKKVFRK